MTEMSTNVNRQGSNMFPQAAGRTTYQAANNSSLSVPYNQSMGRASSPNRGSGKLINFNDFGMMQRGMSPARQMLSRGVRPTSRIGLSRGGSPRDPYMEVNSPENIEKERRFEKMRNEL